MAQATPRQFRDGTTLKHRIRRIGCLLAVAASWSCPDEGRLGQTEGRLEITPSEVERDVVVGVEVSLEFELRNIGNRRVDLRGLGILGAPEDATVFSTESIMTGPLDPGGVRNFLVRAQPEAVTEYRVSTQIETSEGPVSARLRINGLAPPECDDGNVCTRDRFDPELGACTTEFADGVACSSADRCIVDAVCSQGVCLGRSRVCSDDSVCTRDLCRQSDGECVFIADEEACDDGNPCTADGCGPEGCFHEPVAAGTACDDGDMCSVNDACFAGQCIGASLSDGSPCDDGNSCTINTTCQAGRCEGDDVIQAASEGQIVFEYGLAQWPNRAFLHRREVSLSNDGRFVGLDHLSRPDGGLIHQIFSMKNCGTEDYIFQYQPPSTNALVRFVRRALQVRPSGQVEVIVGVRQLEQVGYRPQTTSYRLDREGEVLESSIAVAGGETGWSLTPDGSFLFGVVLSPSGGGPGSPDVFTIFRRDRNGENLWRHDRGTVDWAEFLGVAGPRVLFWSENRFGALDFATGAPVWSRPTAFIPKEMALSTALNLGVARAGGVLIAVELLDGDEVFRYPSPPDEDYVPRTDPIIGSDGRILLVMERRDTGLPIGLDWVELNREGEVQQTTPLPYTFPPNFRDARHEDFSDDPYPTVADDGVAYFGYGDRFWAINPDGDIRWTLTSTVNGFTGSVPLLRDDDILLINEGSRRIIGVKTNGGRMDTRAWSSFRNDAQRTNYTP